ncbi:MAG TPA: prepilin peptidase [Candidatus Bathyarchaeia archaeon]|nr:prepilin peptidase [Candidatus Bathyarchaeia archaeon]
MDSFFGLFLFLLSLAVGSFLNVVVYRLNNPDSVPNRKRKDSGIFFLLGGRSFCDKCRHQLSWSDNIPLISFIVLKRKCRYCRKPISWQYPLVELATAVWSIIIYNWVKLKFGINLPVLGYYLFISYCLIALFVSDLLYQTLPDPVSYLAILITGVHQLINWHLASLLATLGAAAFFLFLHVVTKGKGMAIGDAKLVFLLGLFLGWPVLAIGLYLAFLTGAVIGVILILAGRAKLGKPIPFGPFLIASAWLALFTAKEIIALYLSGFWLKT